MCNTIPIMTQKLLVMERDTKDELQEAIIKNVLQRDNHNRISAISVLEQMSTTYVDGNVGHINQGHFEAWIVLEVPENKDRLYDVATAAGFESQ